MREKCVLISFFETNFWHFIVARQNKLLLFLVLGQSWTGKAYLGIKILMSKSEIIWLNHDLSSSQSWKWMLQSDFASQTAGKTFRTWQYAFMRLYLYAFVLECIAGNGILKLVYQNVSVQKLLVTTASTTHAYCLSRYTNIHSHASKMTSWAMTRQFHNT